MKGIKLVPNKPLTELQKLKIDNTMLRQEVASLKKQLKLYGVVKSLPSKDIMDYLERSEDFYIDDSETANRFYNAALNDVKYFIEKEEEKLK